MRPADVAVHQPHTIKDLSHWLQKSATMRESALLGRSLSTPTVVCEGWLIKRGRIVKNHKRRYFTLCTCPYVNANNVQRGTTDDDDSLGVGAGAHAASVGANSAPRPRPTMMRRRRRFAMRVRILVSSARP